MSRKALLFCVSLCLSLIFQVTAGEKTISEVQDQAGLVPQDLSPYLEELMRATYANILAMVEPRTGFPHDVFDAVLFDVLPQLPSVRAIPYVNTAPGASLKASFCKKQRCRVRGYYGLKLKYNMPAGTFGSYNVDSSKFDASTATYLEAWVKGANGGERFEFVLWSDCAGGFPGRPESALITTTASWEQKRLPLADFEPKVNRSSLCRLSIGFNDAIHPGGTVFVDDVAFVDSSGNRIHVPLDEETSVTNIGLYIASVVAALDLGWLDQSEAESSLNKTLRSIELLRKHHGFPQSWNHVISRKHSEGDLCISTVDLGNFAAGLILLRQRFPKFSTRVSRLLKRMDWKWLYDSTAGLLYGCRFPDGTASAFHYDFLAADSRLAYFVGIGSGKAPPASWGNLNRDREPGRCSHKTHFAPGWKGGGLFMQLLPAIFLKESQNEIGDSARNFVEDQSCYAEQIGARAWGWSATALPPYGGEYCGFGCQRDEILVPHAGMLAAEIVGSPELTKNLMALEALKARRPASDGSETFDFGFHASVQWRGKRQVASKYLLLDQCMAFLSLFNLETNGGLRDLFYQDPITRKAVSLIPDYE